jgi:charged multivesicular body protein 1
MVMDQFESQFEDLDVQTGYMEGAMAGTTTMSTPQDEVDSLMHQVADEHGLELNNALNELEPSKVLNEPKQKERDEDQLLTERLRALRQ